jgi:hypothetical protein
MGLDNQIPVPVRNPFDRRHPNPMVPENYPRWIRFHQADMEAKQVVEQRYPLEFLRSEVAIAHGLNGLGDAFRAWLSANPNIINN